MPETTHEGNDPMGAPATHRGPIDTCPAPDCQDRVIEQQATWVDGDPLLESVAAAVHEQCETGDGGIVHDDPRNIAVAALTAVQAVLPDRATVLRELHDRVCRGEVPYEVVPATEAFNRRGVTGVLVYAQTAFVQWLCQLAEEPAEHREPHPTHGDVLTALSLLPTDQTADAPTAGAEADRVVAYRCTSARVLRCLAHAPEWVHVLSGHFVPVTSSDLPDGGHCTLPGCGVDVLIPQEAKRTVSCSAVTLRVHHAPHGWEPQPGMDPVPCGGYPQDAAEA